MINLPLILEKTDHTLLTPSARWEEIRAICDDGIRYYPASVCIPASFVRRAAEYAAGRVAICTVIGFPNGYSTTAAKCFEAADAVANGADEIDMVINIGDLKDHRYEVILDGDKECQNKERTCLLDKDEIVKMCEIVSRSDADFIKTSTGFSTGGAKREDVALMKAHLSNGKKLKAAGGIASLEDAMDFIALGADRLGTSRIVRAVKALEKEES